MKLSPQIKSNVVYTIALLYMVLFVYAAISKLLDYDNFQAQLGQSPLLGAFVGIISWLVPAVEIIIAIALINPKLRVIALYFGFSLMVMFTAYIYIILNFSNYIPCSCGGILEELNWTDHLIFNSTFVLLAAAGLLLSSEPLRLKFTILLLVVTAILSTVFIALLNYMSEDLSKNHNSFIRNFHFLAEKRNEMVFDYNSNYIAGIGKDKIYLGNYGAPFQVTVLDTALNVLAQPKIELVPENLTFHSAVVRVRPPYFFFIDGTTPCVFRGMLTDWKATLQWKDSTWFSHPEIIDSVTIAFKTSKENLEATIGTLNIPDGKVNFASDVLTRQIDGRFDSDGTLQFDSLTNRLTYLYRYRNQYTLAGRDLNVITRGKTIDTISKAKIEVADIEERRERKMSKPPLIVNKGNVVYKNLLFVNAGLVGRYEDPQMWKESSIIDVYDTDSKSYISSFYIYNVGGKKVRSFMVREDMLYAMIGNSIVSYRLNSKITDHYRKPFNNSNSIN